MFWIKEKNVEITNGIYLYKCHQITFMVVSKSNERVYTDSEIYYYRINKFREFSKPKQCKGYSVFLTRWYKFS